MTADETAVDLVAEHSETLRGIRTAITALLEAMGDDAVPLLREELGERERFLNGDEVAEIEQVLTRMERRSADIETTLAALADSLHPA